MSYTYTKDEALWYAVCQMRRAARVFDLEGASSGKEHLANIYGTGLDICADECEKVMDPEELRRMRSETFTGESDTFTGEVGV
jgi:hypothetical protein